MAIGTSPEQNFFEDILKRESGLVLTPERGYLLETRLLPVAFKHGLDGLSGMALKLKATNDPELLREVVEAMALGDTSFFRDFTPFKRLQEDILPRLIMARAATKTLRIWSAACGSGQEAYSIAMLLLDSGLILQDWKIDIDASDISQEALIHARGGTYTQLDVQRGLPAKYLVKFFTQDGSKWHIKPEVRDMVSFSPGNLIVSAGLTGACDVILCRNVLQNFDTSMQMKVLQSLKSSLRRDGVLMLGIGEGALGVFKPVDAVNGIFGADGVT
ncbi:MAG: protein-glutamate O-methyltransferase CheR [Alphaproteobacteria bacterium]